MGKEIDFAQLAAPFDQSDVKYRIQSVYNDSALMLPYIDSRAVQDRLDSVLGPACWKDEYLEWQMPTVQLDPMASTNAAAGNSGDYVNKAIASFTNEYYEKAVKCTLSIKIDKEWLPKCGIAGNTDIQGSKGGESQSLRRAAVKFGIGRYLYSLPDLWIKISTDQKFGTERVYYKQTNYYYNKPDLTKYTGKPAGNDTTGNTATKPATKSATEVINNVPAVEGAVEDAGPTAVSTAEFRDWQTRLAPLAQANPTAQQMIGLSAKENDSMGKVSKLLGACYNLFTVGSKEQNDISNVMQEKNLPDMVILLKNCIKALEGK